MARQCTRAFTDRAYAKEEHDPEKGSLLQARVTAAPAGRGWICGVKVQDDVHKKSSITVSIWGEIVR